MYFPQLTHKGQYVSANGINSRLLANRGSTSTWEYFVLEQYGNNVIAIISGRNGLYVSVGSDFTLAPTALNATNAELFEMVTPNGGNIGSALFPTAVTRALPSGSYYGSAVAKNTNTAPSDTFTGPAEKLASTCVLLFVMLALILSQ